jgi:hypothetical protein
LVLGTGARSPEYDHAKGVPMPVRIFEGVRDSDLVKLNRRNMERRFYALASAVRDHEARVRRGERTSAVDESLYRRLRELCGDPDPA